MRKNQRLYLRSRVRKKHGARRARAGRVFVFTAGFIIFIALSLYSLSYIKKKIIAYVSEEESHSDLSMMIDNADVLVADALFNLGVSVRDVKSKRVSHRGKNKIEIKFTELHIDLPEGIQEKAVVGSMRNSLSKHQAKPSFKRSGDSLIAEIKIRDMPTHKISFNFRKPEIEKRELKTSEEKKDADAPEGLAKIEDARPSIRRPEIQILKEKKPRVVIIVDDLGLNKDPIDRLSKLSAPISFAILPNLPYSRYAAEVANDKGWDVILHLPMEPKESSGYIARDAGDGALLVGLPKKEILLKLEKNLASIPHVKGVNNHMGSKFTENAELMELVLKDLKNKGLFFIDSRTSPNTTGFEVAKKLGVRTGERDFFLDNSPQDQNYIKSQIKKLVRVSKQKGYAIAICHPHGDTVSVLSEMIPIIEKEVDIIPASTMVN